MRRMGLVACGLVFLLGLSVAVHAQSAPVPSPTDIASSGGQLVGEAVRCDLSASVVLATQEAVENLIIDLAKDKQDVRRLLLLNRAVRSLYESGQDRGRGPLPSCDGVARAVANYLNGAANQPQQKPKPASSPTYSLHKFEGTGTRKTQPFQSFGPWDVTIDSVDPITIIKHSPDGQALGTVATLTELGHREAHETQSGTYYLEIVGGRHWLVQVATQDSK